MLRVYEKIAEEIKRKNEMVLCTVTNTKGSVPRQKGAKMIVYRDGSIWGTIGGGNIEKRIIQDALIAFKNRKSQGVKYDLVHDMNMCCGGSMEIFIEPIMNQNKLYIFGAGHTGNALAAIATGLDFEVSIFDDRKDYLNEISNANARKVHGDFETILPTLPFDENTYVVILTYSHPVDRKILAYGIKQPFAYLGMIGSQRKVEVTIKLFLESGICTEEELEKVDMPMGLQIGAEGPYEIAISIMAKLLAVKNKVTL
jgi:xanthine dehydrogenase accessory factor